MEQHIARRPKSPATLRCHSNGEAIMLWAVVAASPGANEFVCDEPFGKCTENNDYEI